MDTTLIRRTAAIFAAGLFIFILACVLLDSTSAFDDPVRYAFYELRGDELTFIAKAITNTADKIVIIALCIILLIIPATRIKFGVPLSAGALGVTLINQLLKHLIRRPRPEIVHLVSETGYSFPSGHSITSMFFYCLSIWLVRRYVTNKKARDILTVILAVPMLLVGPTRIYLGVHYPTDVLAGWCLGFLIFAVVVEIIKLLSQRKVEKNTPADRSSL